MGKIGDRVRVTGMVEEYEGMTEVSLPVDPDAWEIVSRDNVMAPLPLTTGKLELACNLNGESYEGMLVTFSDVLITDQLTTDELIIDDGSGPTQLEDSILDTSVHLEILLGYDNLVGTKLTIVTGVVRFIFGNFEVHPRLPEDVQIESPWSRCAEHELQGDFNKLNGFTLGDAMYVAQSWAEQVPPIKCMNGDFNERNGFTLGDAIFVAQVWAEQETFPWNK